MGKGEIMFKVGDKVSLNKTEYIGKVVRITEKRQDVVVAFNNGNYAKFNQSGREIGGDVWHCNFIYHLTAEIEKDILDKKIVRRCKNLLAAVSNNNITPDKARKIIRFFEQEILSE